MHCDTDKQRTAPWSVNYSGFVTVEARFVGSRCFWQLRQIRCVRRSLDEESVATLVTPLSPIELTIAAAYWLDHPKLLLIGFNRFYMLLHES